MKKSLFEVGIDFCSILMPTCLRFCFKNPPKSIQKPILKGIDFLIDFDIDFKTAQEGPKTAQDAPRRRSKRQDGPKSPPRRPQDGPKRPQSWGANRLFSILAAKGPQGHPETPPRVMFGPFLLDFWSIIDGFCIDFWSIFDSLFG